MSKGTTVRLTEQARMLLVEKAEDYNTSMKAVASEAIFLFAQDGDNERIAQLKARIVRQKQAFVFYVFLLSVGMGLLGFVIGILV